VAKASHPTDFKGQAARRTEHRGDRRPAARFAKQVGRAQSQIPAEDPSSGTRRRDTAWPVLPSPRLCLPRLLILTVGKGDV